jgi:hypothetical protein
VVAEVALATLMEQQDQVEAEAVIFTPLLHFYLLELGLFQLALEVMVLALATYPLEIQLLFILVEIFIWRYLVAVEEVE